MTCEDDDTYDVDSAVLEGPGTLHEVEPFLDLDERRVKRASVMKAS